MIVPYWSRIAIVADMLANAIINGAIGLTISARADLARLDKARWGCLLCGLLNRIQRNHCPNALSNARLYAQNVLDAIDEEITERYI